MHHSAYVLEGARASKFDSGAPIHPSTSLCFSQSTVISPREEQEERAMAIDHRNLQREGWGKEEASFPNELAVPTDQRAVLRKERPNGKTWASAKLFWESAKI